MYDILVAKYSELGDRERNEDFYLTGSAYNSCFFALADGLGGHGLGDEASKSVCHTAIEYLTQNPEFTNEDFPKLYDICQEKLLIHQESKHANNKMRTTLNLLCIKGSIAYWSHIGDSRTYYIKDYKIEKRTSDHSVSQMLASVGEISDQDIRFHEDRNRLLRVLGDQDQDPKCEVETPVQLTGNQKFLLCSDGFWEFITEQQILQCLTKSETPTNWLENMLELVHQNKNSLDKKMDNTTIVAVWIKRTNNAS